MCWGKRSDFTAARPQGELGNRSVDWKGGFARRSRDARAGAPFVHSPSASRSVRRRHLALCRRRAHSATDPKLVKKRNANLSSLTLWRRISLHDHGTATPLRGSTRPSGVFPCIGTGRMAIWTCVMRPGSLRATAELRRCRAGPCRKAGWRGAPDGARSANPGKGRAEPRRSARSDGLRRGVSHPIAVANGTAPFAATPTVLNWLGTLFSTRSGQPSGNVSQLALARRPAWPEFVRPQAKTGISRQKRTLPGSPGRVEF